MAKPIFVMHVYHATKREKIEYLTDTLKKTIGNEYHVLVLNDNLDSLVQMECFNDCNGLPNKSIEDLISIYDK